MNLALLLGPTARYFLPKCRGQSRISGPLQTKTSTFADLTTLNQDTYCSCPICGAIRGSSPATLFEVKSKWNRSLPIRVLVMIGVAVEHSLPSWRPPLPLPGFDSASFVARPTGEDLWILSS
jgi:hypothetical protein